MLLLGRSSTRNVYSERAISASLPPLGNDVPLVHWLRYGKKRQIVPTSRFDEAFYRKRYPDIGESTLWGFAHFVKHGALEGRVPNVHSTSPTFIRAPYRRNAGAMMPPCYRRWLAEDRVHATPEDAASNESAVLRAESRLTKVMRTAQFREIIGTRKKSSLPSEILTTSPIS